MFILLQILHVLIAYYAPLFTVDGRNDVHRNRLTINEQKTRHQTIKQLRFILNSKGK